MPIMSAPPRSANFAEMPVPAPVMTIGEPASICACIRAFISSRVYCFAIVPYLLTNYA